MFPLGKTVTVTPQTTDRFGDRTAGTPVDVSGCVFWQTPGNQTVGGQDTVVWTATLLAPPGTVIDQTDTITVDGDAYEVSSQPIDWTSALTGSRPGVEVTLRKVAG